MGIYTAPYVLAYKVNGASLNTYVKMSAGKYNVVIQEWDNCGWSSTAAVALTVGSSTLSSSGSSGKTFSSLQHSSGWTGYALLPPGFGICSGCSSTG